MEFDKNADHTIFLPRTVFGKNLVLFTGGFPREIKPVFLEKHCWSLTECGMYFTEDIFSRQNLCMTDVEPWTVPPTARSFCDIIIEISRGEGGC